MDKSHTYSNVDVEDEKQGFSESLYCWPAGY